MRQTKFKIVDRVEIDYDDNEAIADLEDFHTYLEQEQWTINQASCYLLGYSDEALEDTYHERTEHIEKLQQYLQSQLDENGRIRLNTRSYTYFGSGKTPLPKEEFLEWAETHKELFEPRPPVILQIKKDISHARELVHCYESLSEKLENLTVKYQKSFEEAFRLLDEMLDPNKNSEIKSKIKDVEAKLKDTEKLQKEYFDTFEKFLKERKLC